MANYSWFKEHAESRRKNNVHLYNSQTSYMFSPYSSLNSQAYSLIYPVAVAIKPVLRCVNLVQGTLMIFGALFDEPSENVPSLVLGLGNEMVSILFDVLNCLVSILSIATRNAATLLNFGHCYNGQVSYEDNKTETEMCNFSIVPL